MTATQYDIVKRFLDMGNTPQRIAKEFNAPLNEVYRVGATASYGQFKTDNGTINDLMGRFFGSGLGE